MTGTLSRHSNVFNVSRQEREKVSKVLLLYADQPQEVSQLQFGSVGVLLGLKHTRTGDTLVGSQGVSDVSLTEIMPPPPVMSASIMPQSHADMLPVQNALQALARTDPSVRIETQEGQVLIHGLGALHLEIVAGRLREEWGIKFEMGKRRVSYRETFATSDDMEVKSEWNTEVGGQPLAVAFSLALRRMNINDRATHGWDGNCAVGKEGHPLPSPDSSAEKDDASIHIARGIHSALSTSPSSSLAYTDVYIKVVDVQYPPNLPLSLLAGASASVLRKHLQTMGTGAILEPYVNVKVTFNEEHMGQVTRDLVEHGAELSDVAPGASAAAEFEVEDLPFGHEGLYVPPASLSPSAMTSADGRYLSGSMKRSVYAICPLSQMLDYVNRLRALSGGHGQFEMANAGFREVSESRKLEIMKELGRA